MSTVSVHTETYRGYELRLTEWLGQWHVTAAPLGPVPWPPGSLADARPSRDAALARARLLIDNLLRHPPEADSPLPRPIPSPEGAEPAHERWIDEMRR